MSEDKTLVVFMGIDVSKNDSITAYWKYDGKTFKQISKEDYEGMKNG